MQIGSRVELEELARESNLASHAAMPYLVKVHTLWEHGVIPWYSMVGIPSSKFHSCTRAGVGEKLVKIYYSEFINFLGKGG